MAPLPPSASILVGCIYIAQVMIFLTAHVLMIWLFISKDEFRKFTAFKIMAHMGVLECGHMIFGSFLAGVMTLSRSFLQKYIDRIGGAFVTAGWVGITEFILLLTINRFLVFVGFRMTKSREKQLYYVLIALTWLTVAGVFGVHMTPSAAVRYNARYNVYMFSRGVLNPIMEVIEFYAITGTLVIIFLLCLATVVAIIVQRSGFANKVKVSKGEMQLLMQSVIMFLYLTLIRLGWHYVPRFSTEEALISALGLFAESVNGLNPVLYLVFNKSVRRHFRTIFKIKKWSNNSVQTISSAATASSPSAPTTK